MLAGSSGAHQNKSNQLTSVLSGSPHPVCLSLFPCCCYSFFAVYSLTSHPPLRVVKCWSKKKGDDLMEKSTTRHNGSGSEHAELNTLSLPLILHIVLLSSFQNWNQKKTQQSVCATYKHNENRQWCKLCQMDCDYWQTKCHKRLQKKNMSCFYYLGTKREKITCPKPNHFSE